MSSQARHSRPRKPVLPRAVLRAAVAASAVGAALAGGAATAGAEQLPRSPAGALPDALSFALDTPLDFSTPPADSDRGLSDGGAFRDPVGDTTTGLQHAVPAALAPAKNLQLNPLAKTGVDPLDNSAGTQVGDFRPVGTDAVTGPLAAGGSLSELPLVGNVTGLLPG